MNSTEILYKSCESQVNEKTKAVAWNQVDCAPPPAPVPQPPPPPPPTTARVRGERWRDVHCCRSIREVFVCIEQVDLT